MCICCCGSGIVADSPPSGGWFCSENGGGAAATGELTEEDIDDEENGPDAAKEAAVGVVGDFIFLYPPCFGLELVLLAFALAADTGTVIVDAEVTATVDALVVEVIDG